MNARLFYIAKDFQLYDMVVSPDVSDPENPFFVWVFPEDAFVIGVRASFENGEALQDIREQFSHIEDLYHINSGNHLTFEMLRDVDFRLSGTEFVLNVADYVPPALPWPVVTPPLHMVNANHGDPVEVIYTANLEDEEGNIVEENVSGDWSVWTLGGDAVSTDWISIADGILHCYDACPEATYVVRFYHPNAGEDEYVTAVFQILWND